MKKAFKLSALVAMFAMALLLVGCVPGTAEKAKAKMEKAGYSVVLVEINRDDVAYTLTCSKGSGLAGAIGGALQGDVLSATYYTSSKAAKEAYNKMKANAKENGSTLTAKLSGKVIYDGGEAAVKAFK